MSLEATIAELNTNIVELIKLIRAQNEVAVQSWSSLVPPAPAEVKEATGSAPSPGAVWATTVKPDPKTNTTPPEFFQGAVDLLGYIKANTPPPPPKPVEATPTPQVAAPPTHDSVRNQVRGYFEKDQGNSSKFKAFLAESGIASVTACPAERLHEIIAFIGGKP